MSLQIISINTDQTANDFKSVCDLTPGQLPALNNLINYFAALAGGNQSADLQVEVGAEKASGTITIASTGPTNSQTMTICGVTITAVTSGASENEFNISATPAIAAANLAAAINESSDLAGIVTAESLLGVVTVSAAKAGSIGNGLVMANVNLANTTVVSFANGSNGTEYTLNF